MDFEPVLAKLSQEIRKWDLPKRLFLGYLFDEKGRMKYQVWSSAKEFGTRTKSAFFYEKYGNLGTTIEDKLVLLTEELVRATGVERVASAGYFECKLLKESLKVAWEHEATRQEWSAPVYRDIPYLIERILQKGMEQSGQTILEAEATITQALGKSFDRLMLGKDEGHLSRADRFSPEYTDFWYALDELLEAYPFAQFLSEEDGSGALVQVQVTRPGGVLYHARMYIQKFSRVSEVQKHTFTLKLDSRPKHREVALRPVWA